jgi:hypothetical protein
VNLTIKNIPAEVVETLRKLATDQRRSLNAQVLTLLEEVHREEQRRQHMMHMLPELQSFRKRLGPLPNIDDILHDERRDRDDRLG